jgi:threonine/homoserine/homoserine lactone efflux protein
MFDVYGLLAGIAIGLSLAIPPGAINALMAADVVRGPYTNGIKIGLGAMTADLTYLIITLIGVYVFFTGDVVRLIVSVAGAIMLCYIGLMTIKGYNKPLKESEAEASKNRYLLGVTIGMANPAQMLWWFTAGAALVSYFSLLGIVGFFIGIFVWVVFFSVTLHYASAKAKWVYPIVIVFSGLFLVLFSLLLLYNGFTIAMGLL